MDLGGLLDPELAQRDGLLEVQPDLGAVIPFPTELISYVEALAAQSAVALENHNLLVAQKELMDSMIKVLAGAITPIHSNGTDAVHMSSALYAEHGIWASAVLYPAVPIGTSRISAISL